MEQKKWQIDPTHSEIGFSVKHMMFTTVKGTLKDFSVQINSGSDFFDETAFQFSAAIQSIDTANEDRDNHLKSADFFDAEQFPNILFKSRTVNKIGTDEYEVIGDLTIKGITKTITLRGKNTGFIDAGMMGGKRAGFSAIAMINRKDFGLNWNRKLDQGGLLVGNEVTIELKIQAVAST